MARTVRLDVLDSISIASPCTADWNTMTGDEHVRFCAQCRLNVYNLSAMSRDEALDLVQRTQGRLCARFFRRADGTVLTQDCPVGLRALRRKAAAALSRIVAAAACIAGSAVMLATGRSSSMRLRDAEPFASLCRLISGSSPPPPTMIMGDICIKPPLLPTPAPATPAPTR